MIHAYVLMVDHYHLLLQKTPEPNLVRGMTWFQTTYTVRYKAVLVETGDAGRTGGADYFSTLLDYIHLNPVRAGLVEVGGDRLPDVGSYRWSSLPEHRKKPSARPEFLETGRGFSSFGLKDGPAGRPQFVERVALRAQRERLGECGLAEIEGQGLGSTLRRGWCYGSPSFKERMLEIAEGLLSRRSPKRDRNKNYRGADSNDYGIRRAEAIVTAGLAEFDLDEEDLGEMKKSAEEKSLIAAIVRAETSVKASWVAERLHMGSVANVTRASRAIGGRLAGDRRLRRIRREILANISS